MASIVSQNRRRRSHSASPSSPHALSPSKTWRAAPKRALPHPVESAYPSQRWGVDNLGRRKRRRQDIKDIPPSVFDGCDPMATATHTTRFASTSSDFGLYPEKERGIQTRMGRFNLAEQASERYDEKDLVNLRANAFWELQRSVAENGEGLVRRMRDYEHSRASSDLYLKAKEVQRLEKRKALAESSRHKSLLDHGSDVEEDEVQIFAGNEPRIARKCRRTRSVSLDGGRKYVYADERGEKAIAELGLALANGAGGITDYKPVLAIQTVSEEFQGGEMWN